MSTVCVAEAQAAPGGTGGSWGTVLLPFGRFFAPRADLLTRERFKMMFPIEGISPFTAVDEPDPDLAHLAVGERVNDRGRTDLRKDLAARFAAADADFLVVDNTSALLLHREVNGRLYSVLPGEDTALTDVLWNTDAATAGALTFKVSHVGLTDALRARYDRFVRACLDSFDPTKIILVRSHAARFRITDGGNVSPTDLDLRDAALLDVLDDQFATQTGCRVATAALSHFPAGVRWYSFDRERLRRALDEEIVELCTAAPGKHAPGTDRGAHGRPRLGTTAADHVVSANRSGSPVDADWLTDYFAAGEASYDDLLALVHLKQRSGDAPRELVRTCVRHAVGDAGSRPSTETRQRFERSVDALRHWPWGPFGGLRSRHRDTIASSLSGWRWGALNGSQDWRRGRGGRLRNRLDAARGVWRAVSWRRPAQWWVPQIAVSSRRTVFRFQADGSIRRVRPSTVAVSDAAAVVDGRLPVTVLNLVDVLGSWAVHLERGRRGTTEALRVEVAGIAELIDSCGWLDWAAVLADEPVLITTAHPASIPARRPRAKTDLSFVFDPSTRIGTVGGGMADQVTHLALFDELCRPQRLRLVVDDLRYTWWRSHNGFEAARLAPDLEASRLTRLVSAELVERFRAEVVKTRLPWVYSQSQAWHDLGLPEAVVVTQDHANARRLMQIGPGFDVRVHLEREELAGLIREPPAPVTFYTTQQRIDIALESAVALRRVFSFRHLESEEMPSAVTRMAEELRSTPHVAFHVRRGDYLHPHFDTGGWHAGRTHYAAAIDYLIATELGTSAFDVAVFSDDLDFVRTHVTDYGLDRVTGQVRFIGGNHHFDAVYDSYLMSLCPVIVGSVGFFAATTSLISDPPSVFIRARPEGVKVEWRR